MIEVAFPARARAVLDDCLARPYASGNTSGELVAEKGGNGEYRLVLTDVPTGLDANDLFGQVGDDARKGLVPGLHSIHYESPEPGGTGLVFTLIPNADADGFASAIRASFNRVRPAIEATHSRIRDEVAGQGLVVGLSRDDWFRIRSVLADACARHPSDGALRETAQLVEVSLFGDEDA